MRHGDAGGDVVRKEQFLDRDGVGLDLSGPSFFFLRPRMRLLIDVLEVLFHNVRIDLRGGNVRMAEHFLNGAQIRAVFQQVHGKGMAQRVRRDVLGDAGGLLIMLDDPPEAAAAPP